MGKGASEQLNPITKTEILAKLAGVNSMLEIAYDESIHPFIAELIQQILQRICQLTNEIIPEEIMAEVKEALKQIFSYGEQRVEKELETKYPIHTFKQEISFGYAGEMKRQFHYISSKLADVFGCPPEEIASVLLRTPAEIWSLNSDNQGTTSIARYYSVPEKEHEKSVQDAEQIFADKIKAGESTERLLKIITSNGFPVWIKETFFIFPTEQDTYILNGQYVLIDDIAKYIENLETELLTDALTQLPNRRHFDKELERELARLRRNRRNQENYQYSLLTFDIDRFKKINDTWGHAAGDFVLREIGKIISQIGRKEEFFARTGGEEFFGILGHNVDTEEARQCAERIRNAVAEHKFIYIDEKAQKQHIPVTISLGVMSSNEMPQDIDPEAGNFNAFFKDKTDQRLYAAKNRGRNMTVSCEAAKMISLEDEKIDDRL